MLVVDDNATNRRILEEVLTNWRMQPDRWPRARAAALAEMERARAAGQPFPLVLLDAMMPEMDGFDLAEQIRRRPGLAGATLMMLSVGGAARRGGPVPRAGPGGLPDQADQAVGTAGHDHEHAGRGAAGRPGPSAPSRPGAAPPSLRPLRLLLAEDNAVNQRLAVRLLEKRGHAVTVAANGRQAVEALGRGVGVASTWC